MVPWSDNGIFMAGILGVATISYIPFMWLSFVSLILAVIYGYTGKFIWYVDDAEKGSKHHKNTFCDGRRYFYTHSEILII